MSKKRLQQNSPSGAARTETAEVSSPTASLRPLTPEMTGRLNGQLKELRLPTFRENFRPLADQAAREGMNYVQYLAELTSRECQARNHSRIQRLLRSSRLLPGKTWEQFQWSRVPLQVGRQLQSLRDGTRAGAHSRATWRSG
jgi:DNA replication protein DnaC